MAPQAKDTQPVAFRQAFAPPSNDEFQQLVRDTMRDFVRLALTTILEEEVTALIGAARYEQNPVRRDHRNGSYPRDLVTSVGHIEDLRVPRTRRGFRTQVFDRYQRRRREVDEGIGEMFVSGLSTTGVGRVMENLTGAHPSSNAVSRVFHKLADEYEAWKKRKLAGHYVYCFADGTYFSVIYDHEGLLGCNASANADFSGDWHSSGWRTRSLGVQRRRSRESTRVGTAPRRAQSARRGTGGFVDHRW